MEKAMKPLSKELLQPITINALMDLMYKQIWTFAKYLDDSGEVETWKYVDYCLYAWRKEFDKQIKENGWDYPKEEEE
jgi:hypothetical protein